MKSMTGFGSADLETDLGFFSIEIKSVNNRYLDLSFRISSSLSRLEEEMRKMIVRDIRRGRVDISIRWNRKGEGLPGVEINAPLLEKLYRDILSIREKWGGDVSVSLGDFLHVPSLYVELPPTVDQKAIWKELKKGVRKALKKLLHTRREEGLRLSGDLLSMLESLDEYRGKIMGQKDDVLEKYRLRLLKKIDAFNQSAKSPIDRERLEAEVLLYADKCDITEELDRLASHLAALRKSIESDTDDPVGKSLEFICQEILREVNTIGSKARETGVTNLVLAMKNIVEKLREQVQNIE